MEKERERELDRKKEREIKIERARDSFGILYTGYLLSIVKIKREGERNIKRGK